MEGGGVLSRYSKVIPNSMQLLLQPVPLMID